MTEDDLANFFMNIRKNKKFANIGKEEEYYADVKDDFYGRFWLEKNRNNKYIVYFDGEEGEFQYVGLLNVYDIKNILTNERKINDVILMLKVITNGLVVQLHAIARECDENPNNIRALNTYDSDLKLEMATNHYNFFSKFFSYLYRD